MVEFHEFSLKLASATSAYGHTVICALCSSKKLRNFLLRKTLPRLFLSLGRRFKIVNGRLATIGSFRKIVILKVVYRIVWEHPNITDFYIPCESSSYEIQSFTPQVTGDPFTAFFLGSNWGCSTACKRIENEVFFL